MPIYKLIFTALSILCLAVPAIAAPRAIKSTRASVVSNQDSGDQSKPILLAKKKRSGKKAKGTRERIISREARGTFNKGNDKRNIDFDAADIGGVRKTPMGSLVSQSKADKNYDFVKIRLRWHAEMVQSASSLESGGN